MIIPQPKALPAAPRRAKCHSGSKPPFQDLRALIDRSGSGRAPVRDDSLAVTCAGWSQSLEVVCRGRPTREGGALHRWTHVGAGATPPAIANAVFDATGARLRSVPFTPDKVKAALAAAQTQRG